MFYIYILYHFNLLLLLLPLLLLPTITTAFLIPFLLIVQFLFLFIYYNILYIPLPFGNSLICFCFFSFLPYYLISFFCVLIKQCTSINTLTVTWFSFLYIRFVFVFNMLYFPIDLKLNECVYQPPPKPNLDLFCLFKKLPSFPYCSCNFLGKL